MALPFGTRFAILGEPGYAGQVFTVWSTGGAFRFAGGNRADE